MKKNNYYIFCLSLFLFLSCGSKKDIIYLQDVKTEENYVSNFNEYKIKVDDILKITVNSETPEASAGFNLTNNSLSNTKETMIFAGYMVDSNGNINFPGIGSISVKGKTLIQLHQFLFDYLKTNSLLINPVIDIKLLNTNFTILGEVANPGRYEYLKNNLNILEAIGMAGDLTINGERKNIKLIREIDGKNQIIFLDLTKSDILTSNFQIYSGDILIVNPNTTRVKNSGIIGNSGTLLSLLSFILSSIIVISN